MKAFLVVVLLFITIASSTYGNATGPERSPAPKSETTYLQLMSSSRWNDLSDKQQQLYVKAFLETLSFFLYGISIKSDRESAQYFSDFTACAEHEPVKSWTIMTDWLFGDTKATAASQCFKHWEYICRNYTGKGDLKWTPVQLVSANDWSALSSEDKEIYATAYAETEDVMGHEAKRKTTVQRLERCMKNGGEERFIEDAKAVSIESEYPLPWSISRALGKACK